MLDALQWMRSRLPGAHAKEEPEPEGERGFRALQLLTAQMLLVTGADAALSAIRRTGGDGAPTPHPLSPDSDWQGLSTQSFATTWAPTLLAPAAAAAHLRHSTDPSPTTALATRILDAAVIGAGVAAMAGSLLAPRARRVGPALGPLALASAGVLGLMLNRQQRATAAELEQLRRRASVVERLVPRRRARLDRVVVHV